MISLVKSFPYSDKQGTPVEGRKIQQPKRCVSAYHNKDEDNNSKNHNQNNTYQASSKKFRQLIAKSLTVELTDLLKSLSIIIWISTTNSGNLFSSEASEMPHLRNNHCIHPILFKSSTLYSYWHRNTLKSSFLSFQSEYQQYGMPFSNFWMSELCHCATFAEDNAYVTQVYCTLNKQNACTYITECSKSCGVVP